MRHSAPIIVGGGPSGAASAILLARAGKRPLLIERNRTAHDVVCGGFLSADSLALLDRLGLDLEALGPKPITHVRLVSGERQFVTPLPFPAAGLSRARLDAELLKIAEAAGAGVERGLSLRQIDGTAIRLSDGALLEAETVFLATGKHDVRGSPRTLGPEDHISLGMRTTLDASLAMLKMLEGVIELHLFEGGYAGLLIQEDGLVNLCLSVRASQLKASGGKPEGLLAMIAKEAPLLLDRLSSARAGQWSSVARVPYGWQASGTTAGLFRIGDQAAVIASLVGDGIAVALSSAGAATDAFLQQGSKAAVHFQPAFARRSAVPIKIANLLKYVGERPRLAGPLVGLLRLAPSILGRAATVTRVAAY